MKNKKKIACASLLSLGILTGGSFVGNSSVSYASSKIEKKEEGWGKDTFGKDTFYYENGKKKTHSWVITEGNCYYLDN
ncbi:hypothetical protein Q0O06_30210, partial [Bacillus thuringiensis]|uniref:hypothetical protein n=1 Tax=Bacillus thuringiensis TaxID=1428 RepID=UPI00346A3C05